MSTLRGEVCSEHAAAKRGICTHCRVCQKCPPAADCEAPESHLTGRVGRPKISVEETLSPSPKRKRYSLRSRECNSNYNEDNNTNSDNDSTKATKIKTKRDTILQLIESLGIHVSPDYIRRLPTDGFTNLADNGRGLRAAKALLESIVSKMCFSLTATADEAMNLMIEHMKMPADNINALATEALADLALHATRETSVVAQSVLASVVPRLQLKELLESKLQQVPRLPHDNNDNAANGVRHDDNEQANNAMSDDDDDDADNARRFVNATAGQRTRMTMGKMKHTSLRKTFSTIASGLPIPKHNYTFRVSETKLANLIAFVQASLEVKPGVCRDVNLAGHLFKALPIFDRGGKPVKELFSVYKEAHPEDDQRVGFPTFKDIMQLLTLRGAAKNALSTYYIKFRHAATVFVEMMAELDNADCYKDKAAIKDGVHQLQASWEEKYDFLLCEYTKDHLDFESNDVAHNCIFALDGYCDNVNSRMCCAKCARLFTFFDNDVAVFLADTVIPNVADEDFLIEVRSMQRALPHMTEAVVAYASHRLRAKVQFRAISQIQNEWLKEAPESRRLLVLDHKQKVLPTKYREGQVEYFGKQGMPLLGALEVSYVVKDGVSGLVYRFIDIAIKGYNAQDHVQVAGLLQVMMEQISSKSPQVKEIVCQSDNASGFASFELVPFIFNLNVRLKTIRITRWIFTEAQTGRGRLDTHFAFLNVKIKGYVEDGNDVLVPDHIIDALTSADGISGTTVLLVDASELAGPINSKTFKARSGVRNTHDIFYNEHSVNIVAYSGISEPETVDKARLVTFATSALKISVIAGTVSTKDPLFVRTESNSNATGSIANPQHAHRHTAYQSALDAAGIAVTTTAAATDNTLVTAPECLLGGWAKQRGNTPHRLPAYVQMKLKEWYVIGMRDKKRKISAEQALQHLLENNLNGQWHDQMIVTVPKIKAYFSMSPARQQSMTQQQPESSTEQAYDALVTAEEQIELQNEEATNATSLLDMELLQNRLAGNNTNIE